MVPFHTVAHRSVDPYKYIVDQPVSTISSWPDESAEVVFHRLIHHYVAAGTSLNAKCADQPAIAVVQKPNPSTAMSLRDTDEGESRLDLLLTTYPCALSFNKAKSCS
jgi:hypothetical protein